MLSEEIERLLCEEDYYIDYTTYKNIIDTSPQIEYVKYDFYNKRFEIQTYDGWFWRFVETKYKD